MFFVLIFPNVQIIMKLIGFSFHNILESESIEESLLHLGCYKHPSAESRRCCFGKQYWIRSHLSWRHSPNSCRHEPSSEGSVQSSEKIQKDQVDTIDAILQRVHSRDPGSLTGTLSCLISLSDMVSSALQRKHLEESVSTGLIFLSLKA